MADIPIAAASKRKTNHNEMRSNNPSLVLNLILQSYAYFPRRCVQIDGADPCDGKLVGRRIDRAWIFARERRRQKQFAWKTGGTAGYLPRQNLRNRAVAAGEHPVSGKGQPVGRDLLPGAGTHRRSGTGGSVQAHAKDASHTDQHHARHRRKAGRHRPVPPVPGDRSQDPVFLHPKGV